MTVEPLIIAALVASGSAVLVAARLDRWRDHLALAMPAGTAFVSTVSLVLFVAPVRYTAARTLLATLLIAGVVLALRLRKVDPHAWLRLLGPAAILAGTAMPLSLLVRRLRMTRVTADSFEYLQSGGVIEALGNPFDDAFLLVNRQLLVPIVHSLAAIGDEWFLVSLAPLFLLSLVASLWWLVASTCTPRMPSGYEMAAVAAMCLLLLSTNRVVFHAFYVNAHLFVGVFILQLVGLGWLLRNQQVDRRAGALLALLVVPVAIARPEGPLLLLLILTTFVIAGAEQGQLRLLVLSFAGVVLIWWVVGLGPLAGWGPTSPVVVASLCVLVFAVLVRMVTYEPIGSWIQRRGSPVVHASLWFVLAATVLFSGPGMLITSLDATWENLRWAGLWGALPLILAVGLMLAMGLPRVRHGQMFLLPATTFVPLMLLLAYAREGSYRVGPGDSLNRAWLHVIPLAAAYLLLALAQHRERSDTPTVPSS